jgi:hypothetical protein
MKRNIVNISLILFITFGLIAASSKGKTDSNQPSPKQDIKAQEKGSKDAAAQKPSDQNSPKLVPIDIKLPKAMFVGTPQNNNVANLEKPSDKPRPAFYAPAGAANVALGKKVTGSSQSPIMGSYDMVTDGDKEATDGSNIEIEPGLQNITIDLGTENEIYALVAWHYHQQPLVYFDVIVQLSDDPDFNKDVKTIFNNDIDNAAGLGIGKSMRYVETAEGKLIDAKGTKARYVRLYSKGNSSNELNHYIEVEVYGKPLK